MACRPRVAQGCVCPGAHSTPFPHTYSPTGYHQMPNTRFWDPPFPFSYSILSKVRGRILGKEATIV